MVVVGAVPPLARVAGVLGLAGALCRLVVPAFPLAKVPGGPSLGAAAGPADWLVLVPLVGAIGVAGVLCVRGRLPRLGLAILMGAGVVQSAVMLHAFYLSYAGPRSTLDLPVNISVSMRYHVGAGLVLLIIATGLLSTAQTVAVVAWARTVMEDDGSLDPLRPRFAVFGLLAAAFAMLVLGMAPYTSSLYGSALSNGAPPSSVLERAGLDYLAGLTLVLGVAIWSTAAAALRPRLATVGIYVGLAAALATEALSTALLASRSRVIGTSVGGVGTWFAVAFFAALAFAAWRLPVASGTPSDGGQPAGERHPAPKDPDDDPPEGWWIQS